MNSSNKYSEIDRLFYNVFILILSSVTLDISVRELLIVMVEASVLDN